MGRNDKQIAKKMSLKLDDNSIILVEVVRKTEFGSLFIRKVKTPS
jgi:hypothetical protein